MGSGECVCWAMMTSNISFERERKSWTKIMLLLLTRSLVPTEKATPKPPTLHLPAHSNFFSFIHNNKDMTLLHRGRVATEKLLVCLDSLICSLVFVRIRIYCEANFSSQFKCAGSWLVYVRSFKSIFLLAHILIRLFSSFLLDFPLLSSDLLWLHTESPIPIKLISIDGAIDMICLRSINFT